MKKIDKIFILHYSKLKERKSHLLEEAEKWFTGIPYEFMELWDQEELTDQDIEKNFDLKTFTSRFNRDMSRGEMSLCMKYKTILDKISKEKEGELFLILEDDVIFKESLSEYIEFVENLCSQENIKYDCLFMGEAWIRKGDNRNIFAKKSYPSTNGLCTVLYTRDSVEKLDHYLKNNKITQPLDWQFNDAFEQLGFEVYWGKAITRHGSVIATEDENFKSLKSSLRTEY
jgi:GR25 family glycosyltransferase involved in LPS biosynthesis